MKKGFKSPKLMAVLMAALVSANSLPVTAFAVETDLAEQSQAESIMESEEVADTEDVLTEESQAGESDVNSGVCGEDVIWTLDDDGVLTISGTGDMADYTLEEKAPWYDRKDDIVSVNIESGVTSIGEYAFYECTNITNIELPEDVAIIEAEAFSDCGSLTSITFDGSAPEFGEDSFSNVTATAYYSSEDESWTEEVRQDYGGTITWSEMSSETVEAETQAQALVITQQPKTVVGKIGDKAVFTVEAEGDGVSYQWQYSNSGSSSWKNSTMAGSTTNKIEVNITKGRLGQKYRCIVMDSKGNKLTSEVAEIQQETEKELAIIQQPKTVVGKIGDKAVFTVEAEGNGLTYQWQYSNSGSSSWKNSSMTGSTTNKIEVNITKGRIGQKYRCIVKDNKGNELTTDAAEIQQESDKKLAIIQQPKTVVGKIGDKAVFTVEAEGDGLSYQWQYCNSGSSSWKNSSMTGSKTNKIEVNITKGRIGQKYRCVVKDSKGNELTTEAAEIQQESDKKLAIIQQPKTVVGKIGDKAVFTVEAEGDGLSYQWQYCNSGSSTWKNSSMTGSTTNKIEVNITKGRIGQKYRCIVKDNKGNELTTDAAEIQQESDKKLAITQQPKTVQGNIGDTAVFTVEVEGNGLTYQWQYCSKNSSSWKNSTMTCSKTNKIEVKITEGRIGQKYRCVITDSKGKKVTSDAAELSKKYTNYTATFVNAGTNKEIETVEAEKMEATAGLPAGDIIKLPKSVADKKFYIVKDGNIQDLSLEAVVNGSSASYDSLELFFYVTEDIIVYVTD